MVELNFVTPVVTPTRCLNAFPECTEAVPDRSRVVIE